MSTSSVSRSRATNLTGLIDIDALVEANLLRQKTKLNTATQKLKVEQYKQEQYREVITKSKTFYNKYCDILSGGSLISSSSYSTLKFTSNNTAVSATANSTADLSNYKIRVEKMATKSNAILSNDSIKEAAQEAVDKLSENDDSTTTINIGGEKLEFKCVKDGKIDISYAKEQLSDAIDSAINNLDADKESDKEKISQLENAKKDLDSVIKTASVGTIKINVDKEDIEFSIANLNGQLSNAEIVNNYNNAINSKKSEVSNAINSKKSEISTLSEDKKTLKELKEKKENGTELSEEEQKKLDNLTSKYKDNYDFDSEISKHNEELKTHETTLKNLNITAKNSDFEGGIVFTAGESGLSGFKINDGNLNSDTEGKVSITKIVDGREITKEYPLTSNTLIVDGVTFTFNGTTGSEDAVLTGKMNGTELKDKIVDFINDYNELLGHINGKLYETYDRSYLPLTDEDKEGLSDSEIEKLEKKAQTGLLRNDSYLSSFADDMKMTMSTVLTSGQNKGLSLESIGINPVNDYSTKNGLFTIDEDKLLAAIEENPEGIQELFAGSDGIITKLKDNLFDHATGTFSRLANKAGVADGVTANINEMTKDIEQRKKLITEMQTALQEKEDALYTKYASLESSLSSLQAQQSSLSSYFQ
ncbi:flagellar filament capping protein FliD [Clostridium neonatale]|uniref:flagellar filament capping protein FliD n=1 Tax=Clostridium neonatale TaxID=137838 RepID=UPI003D350BF9